MKKYIIELPENTEWVECVQIKGNKANIDFKQVKDLIPYVEPDLSRVKNLGKVTNNAFNNGYICGLDDLWKAIKKIFNMDAETSEDVFGEWYTPEEVVETLTAAEVIEKIKIYEQEEIKAGDEVETENGTRACTINPNPTGSQALVLINPGNNQQTSAWWDKTAVKKTGKTYSEFLSVLKAIKQKKEEEKK